MNKKNKISFGLLLGTSILSLGMGLVKVGASNPVKVSAAGGSATITVNEYSSSGAATELYKNTNVTNDFISVIENICAKLQSREWTDNLENTRCIIDLNSDYTISEVYKYSDFPVGIDLNVKNHTLTLASKDSWEISKGINIDGGGGYISGVTLKDRFDVRLGFFHITGGDLNIKNASFTGFKSLNSYPLFNLDADNSIVDVKDSSFVNCSSCGHGGVMKIIRTNKVAFEYCHFSNCDAVYGGAIAVFDSASRDNANSLSFIDCSFTYCSASFSGGALMIESQGLSLILRGSTFYQCEVQDYGGAIFELGNMLCVTGGTIEECTAQYGGGIAYTSGDYHFLTQVKFKNNVANKEGGAYYCFTNKTRVECEGCVFTNNRPSNGTGTLMSNGSLTIVFAIIAVLSLSAAIVFGALYFKARKKTA